MAWNSQDSAHCSHTFFFFAQIYFHFHFLSFHFSSYVSISFSFQMHVSFVSFFQIELVFYFYTMLYSVLLHCCFIQLMSFSYNKGPFRLRRNCVALPHCTVPSCTEICDITALRCLMKVKFIFTWNAVMLQWPCIL